MVEVGETIATAKEGTPIEYRLYVQARDEDVKSKINRRGGKR